MGLSPYSRDPAKSLVFISTGDWIGKFRELGQGWARMGKDHHITECLLCSNARSNGQDRHSDYYIHQPQPPDGKFINIRIITLYWRIYYAPSFVDSLHAR